MVHVMTSTINANNGERGGSARHGEYVYKCITGIIAVSRIFLYLPSQGQVRQFDVGSMELYDYQKMPEESCKISLATNNYRILIISRARNNSVDVNNQAKLSWCVHIHCSCESNLSIRTVSLHIFSDDFANMLRCESKFPLDEIDDNGIAYT